MECDGYRPEDAAIADVLAVLHAIREPDEGMIEAMVGADHGKTLGERVTLSHKAGIDALIAQGE